MSAVLAATVEPAASAVLRPRILVVDDEPSVVQGLRLQLSRLYDVVTATSGAEALQRLQKEGPFPVLLSDMRMPGMDGARLLAEARTQHPDTVRLLLTGYADITSAIAAVNEGAVFRFLTKPCAPDLLRRALADAVEQHRLRNSERELLEQTLRGAVQALAEVLALIEPMAYGRALRLQRVGLALAEAVQLRPRWPLELAALLSPLGDVGLPLQVQAKRGSGQSLDPAEKAMLARTPELADKILASIPRLEPVRDILREAARTTGGSLPLSGSAALQSVLRSARVLRLVQDFDALEGSGLRAAEACARLAERQGLYEPALLEALQAYSGNEARSGFEVRELPLVALQPGMVLAEDLRTQAGLLLAPRGYPLTRGFQERVRNFPSGHARERVRVMLSSAPAGEAA